MELILKKDVENLGYKDDVVSVKNGYGRNFLIPQGVAVMATISARKELAETLKQRAYKETKLVNEATALAEAVKVLEIKIEAKTADGSKLFGSISNIDIAAAIENAGHSIDKKSINVVGGTVKRIGKYVAKVRLHREVVFDLPFEIIVEKQ
ncbi:MAG: 50S ribosomal protein L9 [Flavobacteriaceae bacterium]|nr:50S ribosomal protein L9 [Flavobacteriaceae bacterium]